MVISRGRQKSRLRANVRRSLRKILPHIKRSPRTTPSENITTRSELASIVPICEEGKKGGGVGGRTEKPIAKMSQP